jgi:phage terminase small subunit
MSTTETKTALTPKQELFCQYFASDREFFGNGTQSYIEAYNVNLNEKGAYQTARACAYESLTKPHILARINELLEVEGLNDVAVDKQLKLVIAQSADYPSKVAAIREYNKLKARIVDKSEQTIVADVTSNGETVGSSQLDTLMAALKDNTANQA